MEWMYLSTFFSCVDKGCCSHNVWRCTTISDLMINEQIRDKEIRLIGEHGEQLGIMSSRDALKLAKEADLDLVKVAPQAKPPVCKIIDYGKYRYEMLRKEKEEKIKGRGWKRGAATRPERHEKASIQTNGDPHSFSRMGERIPLMQWRKGGTDFEEKSVKRPHGAGIVPVAAACGSLRGGKRRCFGTERRAGEQNFYAGGSSA